MRDTRFAFFRKSHMGQQPGLLSEQTRLLSHMAFPLGLLQICIARIEPKVSRTTGWRFRKYPPLPPFVWLVRFAAVA